MMFLVIPLRDLVNIKWGQFHLLINFVGINVKWHITLWGIITDCTEHYKMLTATDTLSYHVLIVSKVALANSNGFIPEVWLFPTQKFLFWWAFEKFNCLCIVWQQVSLCGLHSSCCDRVGWMYTCDYGTCLCNSLTLKLEVGVSQG